MAYTKYSLTPANNNAAPPDGAPEGMLPSAVNDTMRDMMAQIRDVGDGIRGGTYTMTAPVITGGSITGVALSGNTLTNPVITGGSINNTTVGATTASTGAFTTLSATGATTFSGTTVISGSATANTLASSGATLTGGSINNMAVGASTRSTGAFTTLASNGATTFTAGTASTSTTTGTAVITGGLGVSGRINAANFDGIVGANTAAAGNFTTLGATGVATFSAGTVSAPAITTTGDTNTGIYFPAADTIAFTEGGVESMRIDSSGNVGIGTTSPTQKLQVAGNVAIANAGWFGFGDVDERIAGDNSGIMQFFIGGLEQMRFVSSGNLGLGTTSPQARFVVSNAGANGYEIDPNGGFLTTFNRSTSAYTKNTLRASSYTFNISGTNDAVNIDSSGNVGIGTSSPTALLDVNSNTLRVRTARTPASAAAAGNAGDICWDASYIYVCTATNTWKRVAIATW